jgi:hypothetical protein
VYIGGVVSIINTKGKGQRLMGFYDVTYQDAMRVRAETQARVTGLESTATRFIRSVYPQADILKWGEVTLLARGATRRDALVRLSPGTMPHVLRVFDSGHVYDFGTETDYDRYRWQKERGE